jgi:hypothetical protein
VEVESTSNSISIIVGGQQQRSCSFFDDIQQLKGALAANLSQIDRLGITWPDDLTGKSTVD